MLVRLLFFVLLLLPVGAEIPLDRFESAVQAYEKRDRAHPPEAGGTVFVGSSTFALWGQDLEKEFAEFHALNRGFGGSTIAEVRHYCDRLVLRHRPRCIVFYAGTNDIAEGHSPTRIRDDFRLFVEGVRSAQPKVAIGFVSLSMPPCRQQWRAQYLEANRLLKHYCQSSSVTYIDVSGLLLDAQGNPRESYFREDRLHMNASGYALWIPRLRDYLHSVW